MNKGFRSKACLSRKMKSDAEVLVQDQKTRPLKEADDSAADSICSSFKLATHFHTDQKTTPCVGQ